MALRRVPVLVVFGVVLILTSAFAVITSTHQSRQSYAQLQVLEVERWYLEEEHSRLLLEQSTWASHHRIESDAAQSLSLMPPASSQVRVIEK
ncbi:MAG: cell division protein FtsL [Pseudomonadota bacterium]